MNRHLLEWHGRTSAGTKGHAGEYPIAHVLGMFDMATMPGDESVSPHLIRDGFWESWISVWAYRNLVGKRSLFVDIGANTGYYSFLASSLGSEVIAIEANPRFCELIRISQKLNGLHFSLVNQAVSDHCGEEVLSVPDTLFGSASTVTNFEGSRYGGTNFEVECETLDYILGLINFPGKFFLYDSIIIKIDAEGAEEKIWNGMTETLGKKPIVMLEWTPESYSEDFLNRLEDYAPLAFINGNGDEEPVDKDWVLMQQDWVMLLLRPKDS